MAASSQAAVPPSSRTQLTSSILLLIPWTVLVVAFYYRRAAEVVIAGPAAWHLGESLQTAAPTLAVLAFAVALLGCLSWFFGSPHAGRPLSPLAVSTTALVVVLVGSSLLLSGTIRLPFAGSAIERALSSLAAAGLVAFDAFVLGGALLHLVGWNTTRVTERLLFALALGFAGIAYLSLAAASLGLYRPWFVRAMLLTIAAAGATRFLSLGGRKRVAGGSASWRRCRAIPRIDKLWMAVCASALGVALVAALAPETEYDALWYHLWLPHLWLQRGVPVDVPSEYIALYPLTWELVFGAGLAAGGQVAAKLLHFFCLPLTGLAVWQLARRFFPDTSPWLAAALFITTPTVLWEATTAYIDLALAFYVTLGLYAILAYLGELAGPANLGTASRSRTWLLVASLCLAVAVAIKHLGLIVLCVVALLLVVQLTARGRGSRGVTAAFVVGIVALLLASPWYLRAWHATGNPFFPELYKVFGGPAARWDATAEQGLDRFKAHFGFPRTAWNLAKLPWNVTMHEASFGGSIGPLFLAALPALALLRRRAANERRAVTWLACVSVGYVAVWASPVSSFQLRFLVPVLPLFSLLSAAALSAAARSIHSPATRTAAATACAALLWLNLPPFTPLHEGDRRRWDSWLTHVVRDVPLAVVLGHTDEGEYLRRHVPTYGAWQYAGSHLPAMATVLEFGGGDNFYSTRDRLSMDARAARAAWTTSDSPEALLRNLQRVNVGYVLFDKKELASLVRDRLVIASPAFRTSALVVEYQDADSVMYRVAANSIGVRSNAPNVRPREPTESGRNAAGEAIAAAPSATSHGGS